MGEGMRRFVEMSTTAQQAASQAKAAIEIMRAIADTIRELKQVPSGHLYARVMGFMSLDRFNQIIAILKDAGLIEETNHLLVWK